MDSFSQLCAGFLENNVYFVKCEASGVLYLIDPAAEPERLLAEAAKYDFKEVKILLTHAHADHIGAIKEVASALKVRHILLDPDDVPIYQSPRNEIPPFLPAQGNLPQTEPPLDCADFKVLRTPGHTPGGVCYYFPSLPALFSGDTLFENSVGRTDLPGGNAAQLIFSIKSCILPLDGGLRVYPGHGPATTVGFEREHNPYL